MIIRLIYKTVNSIWIGGFYFEEKRISHSWVQNIGTKRSWYRLISSFSSISNFFLQHGQTKNIQIPLLILPFYHTLSTTHSKIALTHHTLCCILNLKIPHRV